MFIFNRFQKKKNITKKQKNRKVHQTGNKFRNAEKIPRVGTSTPPNNKLLPKVTGSTDRNLKTVYMKGKSFKNKKKLKNVALEKNSFKTKMSLRNKPETTEEIVATNVKPSEQKRSSKKKLQNRKESVAPNSGLETKYKKHKKNLKTKSENANKIDEPNDQQKDEVKDKKSIKYENELTDDFDFIPLPKKLSEVMREAKKKNKEKDREKIRNNIDFIL